MEINTKSNQNANKKEMKEELFKILVIGELGTGKTSFIKRYVHQYFSTHYKATIGVDFALKILEWDNSTIIRLHLWDIAGQERFGNMTRVYYKEAVGALIAFDVTRPETLEYSINWKKDLDQKVSLPDGSSIPCVLLANKCDLKKPNACVEESKLNKFCEDNNLCGWFYSSPKENINIDEATKFLVEKILQKKKESNQQEFDDEEVVNLNSTNFSKNKRSCYC